MNPMRYEPFPNSQEESAKTDETPETSEEIDERVLMDPITPLERRFYLHRLLPIDLEVRVRPLKELNSELQKIQSDYARQLYELECRCSDECQEFYEKRDAIVGGAYEPNQSESQPFWQSTENEVDLGSFSKFYNTSTNLKKYYLGVPHFWLHIFTTCETISQIVQPTDIPALKYLLNVGIDYGDKCFTLEFYFKRNPFFANNLLVKKYFLQNKLDEDLCGFDGLKISRCKGCNIHWRYDQNLTGKIVIKSNGKRKFLRANSFFNFFNPPLISADNTADIDEDICKILNLHFKIGNFFREELIPKAFLYFTGDIVDTIDDEEDLVNSDEECGHLLVRDDDRHFANVGRVLRKIHWN